MSKEDDDAAEKARKDYALESARETSRKLDELAKRDAREREK